MRFPSKVNFSYDLVLYGRNKDVFWPHLDTVKSKIPRDSSCGHYALHLVGANSVPRPPALYNAVNSGMIKTISESSEKRIALFSKSWKSGTFCDPSFRDMGRN